MLLWYFSEKHRAHIGISDDSRGYQLLNEAIRVTRPGGAIYFNLHSARHAKNFIPELKERYPDIEIELREAAIRLVLPDDATI